MPRKKTNKKKYRNCFSLNLKTIIWSFEKKVPFVLRTWKSKRNFNMFGDFVIKFCRKFIYLAMTYERRQHVLEEDIIRWFYLPDRWRTLKMAANNRLFDFYIKQKFVNVFQWISLINYICNWCWCKPNGQCPFPLQAIAHITKKKGI